MIVLVPVAVEVVRLQRHGGELVVFDPHPSVAGRFVLGLDAESGTCRGGGDQCDDRSDRKSQTCLR